MAVYLFSGFTESDLTTKDHIAVGDAIDVPGATTHSYRVEDDDARMSGDTITEGQSDDRTQSVSIRKGATNVVDGTIYLDEAALAPGELPDRLANIGPGPDGNPPQVTLRADRTLDYGRVMAVMGELNRAGFNQIQLVTHGSVSAP